MLREPEVGDFDVPVEVEEDVLGLEVAVDDVERVQVVERERDLGRVELRHWVGESLTDVKHMSGNCQRWSDSAVEVFARTQWESLLCPKTSGHDGDDHGVV